METNQVRIRISPDDYELLSELAAGHATRQGIAGIILSAACAAIRENGSRMEIPLHFTVGVKENVMRLNEPATYTKKR